MSMKTKSKIDLNSLFTPIELQTLLRYFPQGIIAFDLETTGLSPLANKIIEISAIKITPTNVEFFDQLINPQEIIPQFTIDIHGIEDHMVKDSPLIEEVLPQFIDFIQDAPLVAHNIKFDLGHIIYNAHMLGLKLQENPIYCSYLLSKLTILGRDSYKLSSLAEFLDIEIINHHRAMDDAIACLKIFVAGLSNVMRQKTLEKAKIDGPKSYKKDQVIDIPQKLLDLNLIELAAKQTPIQIMYKGGSHKNVYRPIIPVSLLPLPQGNVLYALCKLSNHHKSFFLKKITDIKTYDDGNDS